MKKPVAFSLFHDQSVFMTAVMGLMTFLAVLSLGLALAIGTGIINWNRQWNVHATVQVVNTDKVDTVKKVFNTNQDKIDTMRQLDETEMSKLMKPWLGGGNGVLKKYLPIMFEIKFKSKSDMDTVGNLIGNNARFIPHYDALKPSISAGWKMITILVLLLGLIIATIGTCVSFIARNTALLHKCELEILNQVGASDHFITKQMQMIVGKICAVACGMGFVAACPILLMIIGVARAARVGLMAMLEISGLGWFVLLLVPVIIMLFAIMVTKRTTLKILSSES
ncbi:MAG: hypothetical protein J6Y07_03495 [Alphaproteobacteria bacterium]|nr:hypothetical protein [Alphaproteobacteria bacterium]